MLCYLHPQAACPFCRTDAAAPGYDVANVVLCIPYTGVSYGQISAVLACTAVMTWLLFDQTPQGLGLAVLCGLGAPASELLLMKVWGVWHYAQPGQNCAACLKHAKKILVEHAPASTMRATRSVQVLYYR